MNISNKHIILILLTVALSSCNTKQYNSNYIVSINTTIGEIKVRLFDETPLHRDNFITLVKSGIYNGVSFHRVIKGFMIQSGDPATRSGENSVIPDSMMLYTIPAEIKNNLFHKKGALAAARQGNEINPEMRSSGTQFYIVQGTQYTDDELNNIERLIVYNTKQALFRRLIKETTDSSVSSGLNFSPAEIEEKVSLKMFDLLEKNGEYKIPDENRAVYKKTGGTPALDGTYTIFGEVVSGIDIVDKIASVKTDESDKPLIDIRIIKMKLVRR